MVERPQLEQERALERALERLPGQGRPRALELMGEKAYFDKFILVFSRFGQSRYSQKIFSVLWVNIAKKRSGVL